MKLISLTQGQFAKVDDEDFEELSKHKWCARWDKTTKSYYALRGEYLVASMENTRQEPY